MVIFSPPEIFLYKRRPTKHAPDAGDSMHIPSIFLRLVIFLAGRLRHPRPSTGNANRWAALLESEDWRPEIGDRRPETRDRRPETGDQRPETRDRRPETGDQRSETGWRWAALRRPFTGGRLEWKGSLVRPDRSGQVVLGGPLPNIPYTDRGGSGPVDGVGGPGG